MDVALRVEVHEWPNKQTSEVKVIAEVTDDQGDTRYLQLVRTAVPSISVRESTNLYLWAFAVLEMTTNWARSDLQESVRSGRAVFPRDAREKIKLL